MAGVAENIGATLEDKYHRANLSDVCEQEDVPLAGAVALLVCVKLTGSPAPKSAERLVGLWREFIEQKGGTGMDGLLTKLDDQDTFARPKPSLLGPAAC
jgi:cobaltochelatase CobT